MKDFEYIVNECYEFILDDFCGLWLIMHVIEENSPSLSEQQLRELTIKIVRELVEKKKVAMLNDKWDGILSTNVDEIIIKIKLFYDELGENIRPNLGHNLNWFCLADEFD